MGIRRFLTCLLVLLGLALGAWAQSSSVSPVVVPGKTTWPTKEIPSVVLEYKGKVVNHGNGAEKDWYLIYVVETQAKNVQDYLSLYRKAGWTISQEGASGKATKDQYEVLVTFYQEQNLVGITVTTRSTDKRWPTKEYPFVPVFTRCLSSDYTDYEYNLTIDVNKASEADVAAYKKLLVKAGWEGDVEGEEFSWKKDGVEVTLQISNQGGGNWFFDVIK